MRTRIFGLGLVAFAGFMLKEGFKLPHQGEMFDINSLPGSESDKSNFLAAVNESNGINNFVTTALPYLKDYNQITTLPSAVITPGEKNILRENARQLKEKVSVIEQYFSGSQVQKMLSRQSFSNKSSQLVPTTMSITEQSGVWQVANLAKASEDGKVYITDIAFNMALLILSANQKAIIPGWVAWHFINQMTPAVAQEVNRIAGELAVQYTGKEDAAQKLKIIAERTSALADRYGIKLSNKNIDQIRGRHLEERDLNEIVADELGIKLSKGSGVEQDTQQVLDRLSVLGKRYGINSLAGDSIVSIRTKHAEELTRARELADVAGLKLKQSRKNVEANSIEDHVDSIRRGLTNMAKTSQLSSKGREAELRGVISSLKDANTIEALNLLHQTIRRNLAPSLSKSPTTAANTNSPSTSPSNVPSVSPSKKPSRTPTFIPSKSPTVSPESSQPTRSPSGAPSRKPTQAPKTQVPTRSPSNKPTTSPTGSPFDSISPTSGSNSPTVDPTSLPTISTDGPTVTIIPGSNSPSKNPTTITLPPSISPTAIQQSTFPWEYVYAAAAVVVAVGAAMYFKAAIGKGVATIRDAVMNCLGRRVDRAAIDAVDGNRFSMVNPGLGSRQGSISG